MNKKYDRSACFKYSRFWYFSFWGENIPHSWCSHPNGTRSRQCRPSSHCNFAAGMQTRWPQSAIGPASPAQGRSSGERRLQNSIHYISSYITHFPSLYITLPYITLLYITLPYIILHYYILHYYILHYSMVVIHFFWLNLHNYSYIVIMYDADWLIDW